MSKSTRANQSVRDHVEGAVDALKACIDDMTLEDRVATFRNVERARLILLESLAHHTLADYE